jgi:hypothetical protein
MNKKLEYLTPEVDVFTVQTEGVICQSTGEVSILGWEDDGFSLII